MFDHLIFYLMVQHGETLHSLEVVTGLCHTYTCESLIPFRVSFSAPGKILRIHV